MVPQQVAAALIETVRCWAQQQADIDGLLLVGSYARGTARRDSDVDLVLLTSAPRQWRWRVAWLPRLFRPSGRRVCGWYDRDYGAVWSRHVRLRGAPPLELSFGALSWAATSPPDDGTLQVLRGGYRILLDRSGRLAQMAAAVR